MASAQTRRNNARNWIPPYLLTIGIWTGFLGLLSKKLERRALFLSCWFGVFSVMLLSADSGLFPCVHALQRGAGPCPAPRSARLCSAAAAAQSVPFWATTLCSWEVHRREIQMFACLCNVIALVIAPWSMLRNIKFTSHQDVKDPSSAEKWYRRMPNHLLEQLHNALAHCRLSCWFLILVGCWLHLPIVLLTDKCTEKGLETGGGVGEPWSIPGFGTGVCC